MNNEFLVNLTGSKSQGNITQINIQTNTQRWFSFGQNMGMNSMQINCAPQYPDLKIKYIKTGVGNYLNYI